MQQVPGSKPAPTAQLCNYQCLFYHIFEVFVNGAPLGRFVGSDADEIGSQIDDEFGKQYPSADTGDVIVVLDTFEETLNQAHDALS